MVAVENRSGISILFPRVCCTHRRHHPVGRGIITPFLLFFPLLKSMARAFLADITDDLASPVGHGSLSLLDSGNAAKEVDALSTLDVVGELGEG